MEVGVRSWEGHRGHTFGSSLDRSGFGRPIESAQTKLLEMADFATECGFSSRELKNEGVTPMALS